MTRVISSGSKQYITGTVQYTTYVSAWCFIHDDLCFSSDAPSITIAPENSVVDLGREAMLACSTNSDASSIVWEFVAVSKGKLGDPVAIVKGCAVGRDYQLLYDVRSLDSHQCDLVIPTVYPEHVGVYTCKVSKVSRSAMFGIIGEFDFNIVFISIMQTGLIKIIIVTISPISVLYRFFKKMRDNILTIWNWLFQGIYLPIFQTWWPSISLCFWQIPLWTETQRLHTCHSSRGDKIAQLDV